MTDRRILLERARDMRRNPTEPEKRLWRRLSNSQLGGYKFRRQAVVGAYICDFFCPAKNLAVEVDGETHDIDGDCRRDGALAKKDITVIHVTNEDVMRNMEGVLKAILDALDGAADRWTVKKHHPNPSSQEQRL